MRAVNLKTTKLQENFRFSYNFTMDSDLFHIEIFLKLTTMILKEITRVLELLMKNCTYVWRNTAKYFAKQACNFSLILLEPRNFLYKFAGTCERLFCKDARLAVTFTSACMFFYQHVFFI